ncbi:MAG: ABC transporter ATP-binding protein [Deltaproteobacteria bacterium]|nr:ABC transporter ATP-binding protein [Deltaproteobacteria bacterium]
MNDENRVIKVSNLQKTFHIGFFRKKVEAVKDVSFSVKKGDIFGVLGPNGAGKTTTLKIMMGLIFADKGSVLLNGISGDSHKSREKIGYLPEKAYFHEYLTPIELLKFYGKLYGLGKKEINSKLDILIEKVGLSDAAKRPLKKFSKGMLQRVGLAQALIGDPDILVLDEPMSGLDPVGRKFVADLIVELNNEGKTILFSSHILSDIERLCSRVVIFNKGLKVADGALDELLETHDGRAETLESLFMRKAFEENTQK